MKSLHNRPPLLRLLQDCSKWAGNYQPMQAVLVLQKILQKSLQKLYRQFCYSIPSTEDIRSVNRIIAYVGEGNLWTQASSSGFTDYRQITLSGAVIWQLLSYSIPKIGKDPRNNPLLHQRKGC